MRAPGKFKPRRATTRAAKRKEEAAKIGRPQKAIAAETFEKLCAIQCPKAEIASILLVSEDTLERWCKRVYGSNFAVVFEHYRAPGKAAVRTRIYNAARDSNGDFRAAALFAKTYLGFVEKTPETPAEPGEVSRLIIEMPPEESETPEPNLSTESVKSG